jgi:hypothetical protein
LLIIKLMLANASENPVRHSLVEQIKANTNKWIPFEVEQNIFAHLKNGDINLGSLDFE